MYDIWQVEMVPKLRKLAKEFGTQDALSEASGVSKPTLQRLLAGDNEPKITTLLAVTNVLNIKISDLGGGVSVSSAPIEMVDIPVHDVTVSAGDGLYALEQGKSETSQPFLKLWIAEQFGSADYLRIVKVRGDSMEPTLSDGDDLMIDIRKRDRVDGIYVLFYHDMLMVKRVQFEGRSIRIMSDNPRYSEKAVSGNDLSDDAVFRLIGRAVWMGRSV